MQVVGTLSLLFALSPQLAPILGLLILAVSILVGKYFIFDITGFSVHSNKL